VTNPSRHEFLTLVLVSSLVGTTVAAIIALLVCSGDKKVSTKDAFTLFENNTGWANSEFVCIRLCTIVLIARRRLGVPIILYRTYVDPDWM
jgi:hypothetical protein